MLGWSQGILLNRCNLLWCKDLRCRAWCEIHHKSGRHLNSHVKGILDVLVGKELTFEQI